MASARPTDPVRPFAPAERLTPEEASAVNALAWRRESLGFTLGGCPVSVEMTGCVPAGDVGAGPDERLTWSFGGAEIALAAPRWVWDELVAAAKPGIGAPAEDLRPILAHLALEPVLDHLESRIGRPILVAGSGARQRSWTISLGGHVGGRAFEASLDVDPDGLDLLAGIAARLPRAARSAAALPLIAIVRLGSTRLSRRDLRCLRPGDVLLLDEPAPRGSTAALTATVEIGGGRLAVARLEGSSATLLTRPLLASSLELGTYAVTDTAAHAPFPEDDLEGLEVNIVFEIGRHTMSVGDLSSLVPGYVFPVGGSDGPGVMVDIVAAGRTIGRGEIVRVGEGVGVRSTRLLGRG